MANLVKKFTASVTGPVNQKPVAVLATTKIDALLGSIIQLDGRKSFDPEGQALQWKWRFVQVPIGSTAETTGFKTLRPRSTAVSFIPDKTGVYVVELKVNDGELDSDPITATTTIQLSRVPCGENIIPDAHFLWSYLSNFWELVVDREKITTTWSAAIQLIGTELTQLWGNDYNKSLATIENTYQRRWVKYDLRTSLLSEADQRIIVGKNDSGSNGSSGTVGVTPGVGNTSVFYLPKGNVGDLTRTDFTNLAGNYGAKGRVVVINGVLYTVSRAENQDFRLYSGSNAASTVSTNRITLPGTTLVTDGEVQPGDVVKVLTGGDAGSYTVVTVVSETELDVSHLDNPALPSFSGGTDFTFEVVRQFTLLVTTEEVIPDGQAGVAWRIPHLIHIPDVDLEDLGVSAGDIVTFEVTRKDTGLTAELQAQVTGADGNRLGFEFSLGDLEAGTSPVDRELFQKLVQDLRIVSPRATANEVAAAAEAFINYMPPGINLLNRPFTRFRVVFKVKEILHNTAIKVDDGLVSAPSLQEQLKDPPVVLRENLDYIIDEGRISFVSSLFSLDSPSPESLWAECVMLDNTQTIEDNFGKLVRLLADDLTERQTSAPYLSAVKGLFFAYTNGPKVANVRLGLQILLGLPFADERGKILERVDEFSTDTRGASLGRLLVEDINDAGVLQGIRRLYFYPTSVGLEENPSTGQLYAVGDIIERFAPISKGIEVQDYITDPLWWERSLSGLEILKFFTFKAIIDGDVFNSDDVIFAVEFLKTIKPAYTKIITTALLRLEDDVEIEDEVGGSIIAKFYDNDWGLEATNRLDDGNQQGVYLNHGSSKPWATRTVRLLRDVVTFQDGADVKASSVVGWDTDLVRGRAAPYTVVVEGDLLVIHRGQPGASIFAPGVYEIAEVIDANTIRLLRLAPLTDPLDYDTVPSLDANLFEYGTNLICCIMRRQRNPVLKAVGLNTSSVNNIVEDPGAHFLTDLVSVGDHLIIEVGPDVGEYIIAESEIRAGTNGSALQIGAYRRLSGLSIDGHSVSAADVGRKIKIFNGDHPGVYTILTVPSSDEVEWFPGVPQGSDSGNPSLQWAILPLPSYIEDTKLALCDIDGDPVVLTDQTGVLYRIIKPDLHDGIVQNAQTFHLGGGEVEVRVQDSVSGEYFDVFTPGMVGGPISIANSYDPANDGDFTIMSYNGPGRVTIDNPWVSGQSDSFAQSTLYLG
jgi:hypothetical protein